MYFVAILVCEDCQLCTGSARPGLKRATDLIIAGSALILLSPLLVAIGFAVRIVLGRPILFRQERIGRHATRFAAIKFRTMTFDKDAKGRLLPDEDRLMPFGRFLRSTSLDELPELWNVLCGDMSLVGPRPLPTHYFERFTEEENRRHSVLPGMTGWAQIHGRNAISWEDRLQLDVWYALHHTYWIDLKILFRTIGVVWSRSGISSSGVATMPEFRPHLACPSEDQDEAL